MELRQIEPLFVLFTLLALVACAARFVPAVAQTPTLTPTVTSEPTATSLPTYTPTPEPTVTLLLPTPTTEPSCTRLASPTSPVLPTRPPVEPEIGPLAFVDRQERLNIRDSAGTICALTSEGSAASPAWRPDGMQLAYSYQAGEKEAAELRVYDLTDGTHETIWVDPGFSAPLVLPLREIAWSLSGRYVFLGQGCCPTGAIYVLDLETQSLVGQYTSSGRVLWSRDEDLLALTVPQPVKEFIPIGSGESSSIALARPGQITPTLVLTGTQDRMYSAYAWLSADELLYGQNDLEDEEGHGTFGWWAAQIDTETTSVIAARPLESLPLAYDDDRFEAHLERWLPEAQVSDTVWSPDRAWAVFRADQGFRKRQIYAFGWDEGPLVGPLAEGTDLALSPVRSEWRCPV